MNRRVRIRILFVAIVGVTLVSELSLSAQELFRPPTPTGSLTLRLTGPTFVRAGDSPHYRAFLVNGTKTDIEVPSSLLSDGAAYLEWKVVDVATRETTSSPAEGYTWCRFTKLDQGTLVLRPGQRLQLIGIEIPGSLFHSTGNGLYRISLRLIHTAVVQVNSSVTSNRLDVVFQSTEQNSLLSPRQESW